MRSSRPTSATGLEPRTVPLSCCGNASGGSSGKCSPRSKSWARAPAPAKPDSASPKANAAALFGIARELHLDDLVGVRDLAAVALALLDFLDRIHAGDDLAEERVLAGERAAALVADEELRVRRVRV